MLLQTPLSQDFSSLKETQVRFTRSYSICNYGSKLPGSTEYTTTSTHTPQISTTPLLSTGFQVSTHLKIKKHHHKQQAFWFQVDVVNWCEEEKLLISHFFWGEGGRQGGLQNDVDPRLAWNSVIQSVMRISTYSTNVFWELVMCRVFRKWYFHFG